MADEDTNLNLEIIRSCRLFQNATEAEIASVAVTAKKILIKKGDPVFVANDESRTLFILIRGAVQIVGAGQMEKPNQIRIVKPGEHFAELSILTMSNHNASAFALEDAEILTIESSTYLTLLKKIYRFAMNLIEVLLGYYYQSIYFRNGIPTFKDESTYKFDPAFLTLLPPNLIADYRVLPIRFDPPFLTVAFTLPLKADFIVNLKRLHPDIEVNGYLLEENRYETLRKKNLALYSNPSSAQKSVDLPPVPTVHKVGPKEDLLSLASSTQVLSSLPISVFDQLIPHFKTTDYEQGEVIFCPTKHSDNLYFVGTGQIELLRKIEKLNLHTAYSFANQNEIFFDPTLFIEGEGSISAVARTKSRVHSLSKDIFDVLIKRPDFSISLSLFLIQQIRFLNTSAHEWEVFTGNGPTNTEIQNLMPSGVILKTKTLPLDLNGHEITIGSVNLNKETLTGVIEAYLQGFTVKTVIITERDFALWTKDLKGFADKGKRLLKTVDTDPVRALDQILREGILGRSSDIHLEPRENYITVRYRIDGDMLQLWDNIPMDSGQQVIRRTKLLAKMNIAESRLPQDGQFKFQEGDIEGSFRASCVPTRYGEKLVLRLVGKKNNVIPLKLLAPDTELTKFFNRVVKHRQGMFLVTGPTGSGKTTTLYSLLNELNKPDINLITIEDPIEVNITGINQIEINEAAGLTHEIILRNILRQDPDVIMIGEIRDATSMQLSLAAAMTGHLVLSTIHANNSLEVIPRIRELGGSTAHIASALIGVMAQRLVRSLCKECKKPTEITPEELALAKAHYQGNIPSHVMAAVGCEKCNFTGFSGQIPLFEYWEKTSQILYALTDERRTEAVSTAIKASNFHSLGKYAVKMVLQGHTTFNEINEGLFGVSDLAAS